MSNEGRKSNGQFTTGNSGGPGRPRRAIEREYMAALTEIITLDDWRDIVKRAVEQAKSGYRGEKARAWITGLLLGKEPMSLFRLATLEASGYSPEDDIKQAVESEKLSRQWTAEITENELKTDVKKG